MSAKPTNTANVSGNRRGMTVAQREALARGRESRRSRIKRGYVRPRHVTGLRGEAGVAVAGRLRRFVDAYDADPTTAGRVAVSQIMADLWDANTFLKPVWTTVRRIARRINALDLREPIVPGNGGPNAEEIGALEGLNDLVPIMQELGRWFKKTTDVALRLGEISARIHGAGGGNYLEDRYGDGAPRQDEAPEIPPDAADAEVIEEDDAPSPEPAPAEEPPPTEDAD